MDKQEHENYWDNHTVKNTEASPGTVETGLEANNDAFPVEHEIRQNNLDKVTTTSEELELHGCKSYRGIGYGLLSSATAALSSLCGRFLTGSYHSHSISLWRFIFLTFGSLPLFIYFGVGGKRGIFHTIVPEHREARLKMLFVLVSKEV